MGSTVVSLIVYAIISLTTVFNPVTHQVTATATGSPASVTVVHWYGHNEEIIYVSEV